MCGCLYYFQTKCIWFSSAKLKESVLPENYEGRWISEPTTSHHTCMSLWHICNVTSILTSECQTTVVQEARCEKKYVIIRSRYEVSRSEREYCFIINPCWKGSVEKDWVWRVRYRIRECKTYCMRSDDAIVKIYSNQPFSPLLAHFIPDFIS